MCELVVGDRDAAVSTAVAKIYIDNSNNPAQFWKLVSTLFKESPDLVTFLALKI